MYFKKLELFGFKSFADKADLQFEPGITGVVGPNGCGKTNISDAIRWVIGEQSAKQLRGVKMEDVIFNGSRSRQPVGMAEVSLTLDNSQNVLPVDYNEITITRRLFRSGESEYLINKVPCRHKDITELFMDTGIGTEVYSLLESRQIEMILNSKPEDRRFLFEEAAGVMKYKVRKNEAMHKLEQTSQNLLRLGDVIAEVKARIGSLDYQARKARQYQKHQQELKDLELTNYYYSWRQLNRKLEEFETLEVHFSESTEQISTEISGCESKIAQIKLDLTNLDGQIVAAQQKVFGIDSAIARLEDKIYGAQERKKELENRLKEVIQENHQLQEKLNSLINEQETVQKEKKLLAFKIAELEREYNGRNDLYQQHRQLLSEKNANIEADKAKYFNLLNKVSQIKNSLSTITSEQKNAQNLYSKVNGQILSVTNQAEVLSHQIEELNNSCQNQTQSYNQLLQENSKLETSELETQQKLTAMESKLEELKTSFNLKNSLLLSLLELKSSFAGYQEGVKKILAQKPNGVVGTIPELIEITHQEYATLIEMLLDQKLQYIICENGQTLNDLIETLKGNEAPRVTMLSLDELPTQREPQSYVLQRLKESIIGPASDYIKCEQRYRKLVEYLLTDTYIVKDLVTARQIAGENGNIKAITLNGELVTDRVIITLGIKDNAGLLEREIRIKQLQIERDELQVQVNSALQEREILSRDLQGLENQIKAMAVSRQNKLLQLGATQKDHEQANLKLKELQKELNVLREEEVLLGQHLVEHKELLTKINQEYLQGEQEEKQSKENLSGKEQELVALNEHSLKLQNEFTVLKVDLAACREKSEHFEVLTTRLSKSKSDLETELEKIKLEKDSIDNQIMESDQVRVEVEDNINKLLTEKKGADASLDQMRANKQDLIINLRALESKIDNWQNEANQLRQQKHEQEIKYTQLNTLVEQIVTTLHDKYNVNIDEQTLPQDLNKPDEDEIERLRKKIESLGAVNLVAIDEYEQLQERFNFLLKQQEDLTKAQDDIHKVISKINQTTKEYFEKTFNLVQANFSNLFKQLFEGGEGELVLTNPQDLLETGIDIIVQPPGKKLTNISLLSGGEKALTAIAILFAIFIVKPSPFCVLDEIDAPLDDSNLLRFIRMLKEFAQKTQFIMVTHNKKSMEMADVLYGVTMEEFGVSKLVSVKFRNAVPA